MPSPKSLSSRLFELALALILFAFAVKFFIAALLFVMPWLLGGAFIGLLIYMYVQYRARW